MAVLTLAVAAGLCSPARAGSPPRAIAAPVRDGAAAAAPSLDELLERARAEYDKQPHEAKVGPNGLVLQPGFGYVPPANSCSCLWRDSAGFITQPIDCWRMDLNTDPFPSRPGLPLPADYAATVRRYHLHSRAPDYYLPGQIPVGGEWLVKGYIAGGCDAENWLGRCAQQMTLLCQNNAFGTAATHDCQVNPNDGRTVRELTDYLTITQAARSCPSDFTSWYQVSANVFSDGFETGLTLWR